MSGICALLWWPQTVLSSVVLSFTVMYIHVRTTTSISMQVACQCRIVVHITGSRRSRHHRSIGSSAPCGSWFFARPYAAVTSETRLRLDGHVVTVVAAALAPVDQSEMT